MTMRSKQDNLSAAFRAANSPLSPALYFRRNPGKTLPMAFVIVIAVTLVGSVVSIVDSIDLTIYTLYGYNRYLTGLTPRNALAIDPDEIAKVQRLPEHPLLYPTHSYQTMVKTIFGKMFFPIFGLDRPGRDLLLTRCNVRLAQGRLPADGEPEAALSDDVAKDLGLRVGDIVSRPQSEDSFAPIPVRLVGLLHGSVWLGLTSRSLVDANSPLTFTGYMAFASSGRVEEQRRLDADVARVTDRGKTRVWRFAGLVRETRSALSNLYLILNLVIGIIVFAISFVCGLLANIYFTQRLPEIATLSAIGYARSFLLRRTAWETSLLCVFGWALGCFTTGSLLWLVREAILAPKGLLLNPVDTRALLFTVPLPFTILVFAVVTIGLRLSALDPVGIIEHRG